MTDHTPPTLRASAQVGLLARLHATLLAAIYGLAEALRPVMHTIAHTPNRPWVERTRINDRFWAIIRECLALTTRITPESLTATPAFPPPRAPAPAPAPQSPRYRAPRARSLSPITPKPRRPLSPYQLAARLAFLLHQLECLAAAACVALTPAYHDLATQLRTLAHCQALPPQPWQSTA